ncbi:phosphate ABC transporter permease PstA [Methanoregula sp.]|uniref:phosphate ABC transporter permease PstA n=1 Tax=Methanoregula sp. TaxID=2052170 RepID=UPI002C8EB0D2|nr:phosphate ABC transporter permease PstA [Methanoregula sp.]HVP97029.1 phosphate ABC transporter permease PstA [Methanoregula sp.]
MTFSRRLVIDRLVGYLCLSTTIASAALLFVILGYLFIGALPVLSLNFIILPESALRIADGAIGNAIAGTILISVLATLVATPFAFGTAVYLAKYAKKNRFTDTLRFFIEVLSGTPSIVIGIFGFLILVIYLKPFTGGLSLIAGAMGLAILIVPVIERGAEEAIAAIPGDLEEGSYALGATKWQTISLVTVPAALSGIITGIVLGFGRAAEESAVVLLTAGYTQFMPEFAIKTNPKMFLGIQIFPLQDLVATLPLSVYQAYEHANIVPMANGFAAAFVLVCIVLVINIVARTITAKYTWTGPRDDSLISELMEKLSIHQRNRACYDSNAAKTGTPSVPEVEKPELLWGDGESGGYGTVPPGSASSPPLSGDILTGTPLPAQGIAPPAVQSGEDARRSALIPKLSLWSLRRMGIRTRLQKIRQNLSAPASPRQPEPPVPQKEKPQSRLNLLPFLFTLAPFILVAVLLLVLTFVLPGATAGGSNGITGILFVSLAALTLCSIGSLGALFLLKLAKVRIRNRRSRVAAIALGILIVLGGAGLFSAHLFIPAGDSGAGSGLSGLLHLSGSPAAANATDSSDRQARLAAFLAQQNSGDAGSPAPATTGTPAPAATPAPALAATPPGQAPAVPVKFALDVGESYWYGDNYRPCLATVYNVQVLPFYFWWDMDWNRFVQQTPVQSGDVFLVTYIRIENTGNMSAIVPSADEFFLTNNGQVYTHNIYFDTSVLSQNEINYYSDNFDKLPYQWIREIGEQKRDYAYLTGYNVFGENQTVVTNYTSTNSALIPPSPPDTNGQGYFLNPGRSNAIDGYLIYEVPATVAADLKDTYLQTSFNSFSPTRWRLGK